VQIWFAAAVVVVVALLIAFFVWFVAQVLYNYIRLYIVIHIILYSYR
jgi:hypothetical protein